MAISNNKRELEKKKAQKKREKERRKDERRKNGPDSFDDMIAYVDENGNLCDTPPTATNTEVNADTIEISTPKQADIPKEQPSGIVDFFDSTKGFGFIRPKDSDEKYFFHISNAPQDIQKGDKVSFILEKNQRGLQAVDIIHATK
ncbi:MAG: cold shock domain-containing protein [Prevotella sp.]|nr:cold shock domain-containing protein [Prevotella sp.]